MTRKSATTRNPEIRRGVRKYSRSASYKKSGRFAKKATEWKNVEKKAKPVATKEKTFGNGKRTIAPKATRYYPAEDVPRPLKSKKAAPKPAQLRAAITPGTVLILLAGRFRGRRVVFLNQLPSGLLLVTGPYKRNGVPTRRVNQAYVIATSTKVDVTGVDTKKYTDDYFRRPQKKVVEKKEEEFFTKKEEKKNVIDPKRAEDQKALDTALIAKIKAVPLLSAYLKSLFTLRKGQFPHELKF